MDLQKGSDKIRVLHICDKFGVKGSKVHGISRLFSWWFPLFNEKRFELSLCGLTYPDAAGDELERGGISIQYIKRGRLNPLKILDLYRLIRSGGYHITHLHGYGSHVFGSIASWLAGVQVIIHEHFVDPGIPRYTGPFYFFVGRWTKYGLAVSKSVKEFMINKMYIDSNNIQVIYNGTPLDEYDPATKEEVQTERHLWGIGDSGPVIGSIGRLHAQKGFRYLIEAIPPVVAEFPNAKFLIVGDGADLDELKGKCKEFGVLDHVVFTGFSTRVRVLLTMMDVVVIASLYEGTPLTLFESFANGKPIVSTPVDGLGEILEHGETAHLVPPRDPGKIAEGILTILRDKDYSHKLASNAKLTSLKFDGRNTVRVLGEYYRKNRYDPGLDKSIGENTL